MHKSFPILLLFGLFCGYAMGQGTNASDAIYIGTTRLAIGLARDPIITSLSRYYSVQNMAEGQYSTWMVTSKDGPPFRSVASLGFRDGKLSSVFKYWGPQDQQKGTEFANALYGVIKGFNEEGKHACAISVGQKQEPNHEAKAIFIACGEKYVRVDIGRNESTGEYTDITEVLEHK